MSEKNNRNNPEKITKYNRIHRQPRKHIHDQPSRQSKTKTVKKKKKNKKTAYRYPSKR